LNKKGLSLIKPLIKETWFKNPLIMNKRAKYIGNIKERYNYNNIPTIICSNCIGGIIYNNLGLKFQSPTINLWIPESDFIKLISNLKEYLQEDLLLAGYQEGYPLGLLKDITIHFNHYDTFEEAKEKWNERKRRINFDNLNIMMSDRGLSIEDLKRLQDIHCKRLIIFTSKEYEELKYTFLLKRYNGQKQVGLFALRDLDGFREFEKAFDYVEWLNSGKIQANSFKV